MEVVAGSYEELSLAYKLKCEDEVWSLVASFTDHSHTGCLKASAISKKGILATGSTDETIKLFNLRKARELGSLMHHNGMITCIEFYGNGFMFSGSGDGIIGIWKTTNWEMRKTLKGHVGSVKSVSVHPSGKLALSVGEDRTLRTWNLITGRKAFIKKLKQEADKVLWSPDGEKYLLVVGNQVDIYSVATADVEHTIKCDCRVIDIGFCKIRHLFIGLENGKLEVFDLVTFEKMSSTDAHNGRVKALCILDSNNTEDSKLFTASSDGTLKAWNITNAKNKSQIVQLAEIDTTFRLTCVSAWNSEADVEEAHSETKADETADIDEVIEENIEIRKKSDKKLKRKKKKVPTATLR